MYHPIMMVVFRHRAASRGFAETVSLFRLHAFGRVAVACAIAVIANTAPAAPFSQIQELKRAPGIAASTTLKGTVTLACASNATSCKEQPYQVGLLLQDAQGKLPARFISVLKDGTFSISVLPGAYTIISADTRSSCCLPTLQPVTVTITAGEASRVNVRFRPSLQLPTR